MVQWVAITGSIGLVATVFGAILGWGVFPAMVNKKVEEGVVLKEGTEQFDRFMQIPQPISFKVYIFNVTNSEKVQQGALPIVQEVGPYIYKQYRRKNIKEMSNDGTTISYTQQQTYQFDEEASSPFTDTDRIIVLNMHMNAFLQVFEREVKDIVNNFVSRINTQLDRTPVIRLVKRIMDRLRGKRKSILQVAANDPGLSLLMAHINSNLKGVFNDPKSMFVTTTVREYLFDGIRFCINPTGLARTICNQIKEKGSKTIRSMPDGSLAFSMFNHKNYTHDGVYEIHSGKGNVQKLQQILRFDDSPVLNVWANETNGEVSICNQINGTDASSFPPFRKRGDSMYIFSSDICRSVRLYFENEIQYNGIPGFRYSTREFLNEIGPEYSTECFCSDKLQNIIKRKNGCLYPGAMDLSQCVDAPVILTLPHMLGAAKEYTSKVKGLSPNVSKHQMFVDVQYMTGTPLQGGKRVQFNMFLKHINKITLTENLTTSLIPTIWVEEGIALNEEMVEMIKSKLINTLFALDMVHWAVFVGGILLILVSFLLHLSSLQKREPDPPPIK